MAAFEDRNHRISPKDAAALIRRHREQLGRAAEGDHGGSFHADQVLSLLAQPGCSALRYYYGRNENGTRCLVLVGVDKDGKDMASGEICELGLPCPPFCDDSPLTQG